MEVRVVKAFIHAMVWMLVGMVVMARIYCYNLGITSGPMFIDWMTVGITGGALVMFELLLIYDPSFREERKHYHDQR